MGRVVRWVNAGSLSEIPSEVFEVTTGGHMNVRSNTRACGIALAAFQLASSVSDGCTGVHAVFWEVLLGSPWEEILRSPWPVFELISMWAAPRVGESLDAFTATCTEESFNIWNSFNMSAASAHLRKELSMPNALLVDAAVETATKTLLLNVLKSETIEPDGLCNSLLIGLTPLVMACQRFQPLVTPGFGIRVMQTVVIDAGKNEKIVQLLGSAPWPVLDLLALAAKAERERLPTLYQPLDKPGPSENFVGPLANAKENALREDGNMGAS